VVLTWAPSVSGSAPTTYILEAGSSSGASNVIVYSTGSAATSYTAPGVGVGTYFVRVRGANAQGTSAPSNEIAFTVDGSASPAGGPPGPPLGLVASSSGSNVTLGWRPPAFGGAPSYYVVEAGSAPGLRDLANFSTGNPVPSFSAGGIGAGSYFVRVRAGNATGVSAPSNEAVLIVGGDGAGPCAGPPGAPSGLLFDVRGSTVTLSWLAANGRPTSYVVEAGSFSGGADLVTSDLGNAGTSMTATGVGGGTYFVRIRARNACGTGAPSNEVTVVVR
jgi:predicted phage tail protein